MFHLENLDLEKTYCQRTGSSFPQGTKSWRAEVMVQFSHRAGWHQDLLLTDPMGFISRGVSEINQLGSVLSSSIRWFKVSGLDIPPQAAGFSLKEQTPNRKSRNSAGCQQVCVETLFE